MHVINNEGEKTKGKLYAPFALQFFFSWELVTQIPSKEKLTQRNSTGSLLLRTNSEGNAICQSVQTSVPLDHVLRAQKDAKNQDYKSTKAKVNLLGRKNRVTTSQNSQYEQNRSQRINEAVNEACMPMIQTLLNKGSGHEQMIHSPTNTETKPI